MWAVFVTALGRVSEFSVAVSCQVWASNWFHGVQRFVGLGVSRG